MKKILISCYLIVTISIFVALSFHSFGDNQDDKAIAAGEKIYNLQCITCHGETGKGEGAKAGTAINNQHYLSTVSNKDIENNVKYGRQSTQMPSFKGILSEKDFKNLVAYIRNWQTKELTLTAPKSISGNIVNGERLYNLYCQNCHGVAGAGKLNMGTALSNPQFLKYTTDQQIWITTAYGREETRMGPSLKGSEGVRQLNESDITDIVTYIRSLQGNQ